MDWDVEGLKQSAQTGCSARQPRELSREHIRRNSPQPQPTESSLRTTH
jgi:hypothetical protein